MLRDILTIGDKIDVKRLDHTGKHVPNSKTYVSQLVDFEDFDMIQIAAPIWSSYIITLDVGESYELCFYTEKGLYRCKSVVINNTKENNIFISVIRLTSDLEKFQRRQYYRLECILDTHYRIITEEEERLEKQLSLEEFSGPAERSECVKRLELLDKEWMKASVHDISGGGARINSSNQQTAGDRIKMKLEFMVGKVLKKMVLNADIISSNKLINRVGAYEHRVEFSNILRKDREDLIKYIFEQERRRRKNDKG